MGRTALARYNRRHKNTPRGTERAGPRAFSPSENPCRAPLQSSCRMVVKSGRLHDALKSVPLMLALGCTPARAAQLDSVVIAGIPLDFIVFAATLAGIALFHRYTLKIALAGLLVITVYKLSFTGFREGVGLGGLVQHLGQEWVTLANLFCLLMGFALLSRHFEKSRVPLELPRFLPDDWKGGFLLLVMIFVLSSFLDNIAAALIGGAMAHQLFRAKVHIGYLAAIVAASNAGGAGSVVGDTTTTMMWINGVPPLQVFDAYVAAGTALVICGIPAAIQQQKYSPILKHTHGHVHVDWVRVGIVALILVLAIVTNVTMNVRFPELGDRFPFIGVSVWVAIVVSLPLRRRRREWGDIHDEHQMLRPLRAWERVDVADVAERPGQGARPRDVIRHVACLLSYVPSRLERACAPRWQRPAAAR